MEAQYPLTLSRVTMPSGINQSMNNSGWIYMTGFEWGMLVFISLLRRDWYELEWMVSFCVTLFCNSCDRTISTCNGTRPGYSERGGYSYFFLYFLNISLLIYYSELDVLSVESSWAPAPFLSLKMMWAKCTLLFILRHIHVLWCYGLGSSQTKTATFLYNLKPSGAYNFLV